MDNRSFESGASATPPSPPSTPSSGYPTKGSPSTGTPATKPGQYWFHQIGEEMRNVIVSAGLTPSNTDLTQLLQAVQQLIINNGAVKMPARAATVGANITLAGGAPSTLDGVTLVANNRVLVKDQTNPAENGLYVVTTLGTGANGTWTRATDDDTSAEMVPGMLVVVQEGTLYADTEWELATNGPITLGTTALSFIRFLNTNDVATTTSDPTYADNSTKPASTGWIRGAMSAIATAAGFASSFGTNGYIKFPSWLGGFIIQWMQMTTSASADVSQNWSIAFPNALYAAVSIVQNTGGSTAGFTSVGTQSTTAVNLGGYAYTGTRTAYNSKVIGVGY